MRIGNNNQGIWQLFSRMNRNKTFGRSQGKGQGVHPVRDYEK